MEGVAYLKKYASGIKKRRSGYAVLVYDTREHDAAFTGCEEAKKVLDALLMAHKEKNNIQEILGEIGARGSATGRVIVIKNILSDAKRFKKGDILVAGMTRPEFVPIMKKAAAIITDEGGITCHAAIIAREMKKPCIIGTKIAAQLLKGRRHGGGGCGQRSGEDYFFFSPIVIG